MVILYSNAYNTHWTRIVFQNVIFVYFGNWSNITEGAYNNGNLDVFVDWTN